MDSPDSERERPTLGDDASDVVVPAPELWAIVRYATPPDEPPLDLVAFVTREGDHWLLTDDALGFGEVWIVSRFDEWRSTWERTWAIDPLPHLRRLVAIARADALDPPVPVVERIAHTLGRTSDDATVGVDRLDDLAAELASLRSYVVARDATGIGIVDRTPGAERNGLAAAWPECVRRTTVAADHEVQIVTDPSNELRLRVLAGAEAGREIDVEDVEFGHDVVVVTGRRGRLTLAPTQARPLAWIVPGSTAWRVRAIPEVLAWARTFAGLEECIADAAVRAQPVRVTARRPISIESGRSRTA